MLVFKKNIYFIHIPLRNPSDNKKYRDEEDPNPLPFNFIHQALHNSQILFQDIENTEDPEIAQRLKIIFPHAARWGKSEILRQISKSLWDGLWNRQTWFILNCYHQCFLFDCLLDMVEDYSYTGVAERKKLLPEMDGKELDFNRFLGEYFFNTIFLMASERFNQLSQEERKQLGKPPFPTEKPSPLLSQLKEDPTLTKVINTLPPSPEDLQLKSFPHNPYV